jgi:hypothetical protein
MYDKQEIVKSLMRRWLNPDGGNNYLRWQKQVWGNKNLLQKKHPHVKGEDAQVLKEIEITWKS